VPVVTPDGTVTVNLLAVALVTVAATLPMLPANVTTLLAGVVLKLSPSMYTVVPVLPPAGLNPLIAGPVTGVKTVWRKAALPAASLTLTLH